MRFDSHLLALMTATVGLVNTLTDGESGGRVVVAPRGRDRTVAAADLLTPAGRPRPRIGGPEGEALAAVAVRLREVFEKVDADDLSGAAGVVNDLLRESGARPQLDNDPVDGWNVHFHGSTDGVVPGWTAGCATGLALALGSDLAGRLGVCAADHCDRVYVDDSRNGAKRFCSTSCQNRAKAAAFRARSADRRGDT